MSKNILICTENLSTGGVETVVFNQALALKEKGYTVTILSGDGEYRKKIEEKGIQWIEYDFKIKNSFDVQDIEKIVSILKQNNIGQIYVHKTVCIPLMTMICTATHIPYVFYVHDELEETYNWFINNFPIYELSSKIFLENAYKIICISENAKKYNQKYFKIPEEKYLIVKNSINFDYYKCENIIQKNLPENFVLVGRIAHEKFVSAQNAIELFCAYSDKVDFKTKLTIIGSGDKVEELKNIIETKKEKYNIEYKGSTSDVSSIINQNDVVLGMNRCALEAMAIKRIVILSGYENLKGIIKPENIDLALEDNLSGNNLETISSAEQVQELLALSREKIEKITEENYKKLVEKNNILENLYTIPEEIEESRINYQSIFPEINKTYQKINNLKQENENIWKEREYFKKQAEWKEKEIEELQKQKEELIQEKNKILEEGKKYKQELVSIKNRKIYKFISKITGNTKFRF